MVIWSTSVYSVKARTVTRPIAPAPPRTMICIEIAPYIIMNILCYSVIAIFSFRYDNGFIANGNAGRRDGCMQFLERILQAVQDGVDLLTGNNQWWLDTNNARIIKSTRNEYAAFEKTRSHGIANIIIDKMLAYKQAFPCNMRVDIAMASSDVLQLLDKVFTLFSSLLRNALFKGHIDGSNSSSTCQGITARGRGVNERIAVHDTPDFRC